MSASFEEILEVHEIGERIAESVIEFFTIEDNRQLVERLKAKGLQMEIIEKETVEGLDMVFEGKTVVVSGVFERFDREELKGLIKSMGGKIASGITGNTDFLVAGDKMGPAKLEKAEKLGTKILSEAEFIEMSNL